MLKTVWKSREEIEYSLKNVKRISIISCDACAKGCGTGGSVGIGFLQGRLREWGKELVFTDILFGCCVEDLMRLALAKDPRAISKSDALVLISCSSGVKSAFLCDPGVPVVAVLDSVGCEVFTQKDDIVARSICRGCGECVVTYTGGICPLAECPARTKYGPCKKSPENGTQCAVNPLQDCVWKEIAKRGNLAALAALRQIHNAKGVKRLSPTVGRA